MPKRKVINDENLNNFQVPVAPKRSNYDKFESDFEIVLKRVGGIEGITIRDIKNEIFDDEGIDKSIKALKTVRRLIITEKREEFIHFYTVHSEIVNNYYNNAYGQILFIPKELKKITLMKNLSEKFDALLSLTLSLDFKAEKWLNRNNIDELDDCILLLSSLWKAILINSNEELKIDAEYTLPGVEYLLEKFTEAVEAVEWITASFTYK
jgi:hypothetical protein